MENNQNITLEDFKSLTKELIENVNVRNIKHSYCYWAEKEFQQRLEEMAIAQKGNLKDYGEFLTTYKKNVVNDFMKLFCL